MEPKAPLAHCEDCPLRDAPFVPGHGPGQADMVIVGEAPGSNEVATGIPFTGRAGQLLNRELGSVGISRGSVYVTNAVLCHPEKNRTPTAREIRHCNDRLIKEIEDRRPKKVLTLGAVASRAVMGSSGRIADLRLGRPKRSPLLGEDVVVGSTYHPGAVLRNRKLLPSFVSDIRKLLDP